ncbi:MAG: M23 family metallopeptidase [Deltaproteobacteria bacterium]|nr:M23 family metallopeptidase [Deltaproteobacteria bacterium]
MKRIPILLTLVILSVVYLSSSGNLRASDREAEVAAEFRSPRPGEALLIRVTGTKEIEEVSGSFLNHTVYFYDTGNGMAHYGFSAIGLGTQPGRHLITLHLTYRDGSEERLSHPIAVRERLFTLQRLTVDEGYVRLTERNLARYKRESEELSQIFSAITPERLFDEGFGMPLRNNIPTARFGVKRLINGEKRSPHKGLDLKGTGGVPVYASNGGKVVMMSELFFTGKTVIIDHGLGIYSLYAHLSRFHVGEGEMVSKGRLIGRIGSTGRVTGPHLHWAIKVGGKTVDPVSLLELPVEG